MLEIERKYLVRSSAYRDEAHAAVEIIQGFLNTHPDRTVRVRLSGDQGFITVKGRTDAEGVTRFEWEREIPPEEAKALLEICQEGVIHKIRHLVKSGRHLIEVDEFRGENEGLVVAEIEIGKVDERIKKPDWLGEEVTGDPRYYNSQLSKKPYTTWKKK
jgi:CYTH domain-containing protein